MTPAAVKRASARVGPIHPPERLVLLAAPGEHHGNRVRHNSNRHRSARPLCCEKTPDQHTAKIVVIETNTRADIRAWEFRPNIAPVLDSPLLRASVALINIQPEA